MLRDFDDSQRLLEILLKLNMPEYLYIDLLDMNKILIVLEGVGPPYEDERPDVWLFPTEVDGERVRIEYFGEF